MHLIAALIGVYTSLSGLLATTWAFLIIWDCKGGMMNDVEFLVDPHRSENSFATLPAPLLIATLGGLLAYWGFAGS